MYGITIFGQGFVRSAEIQRQISDVAVKNESILPQAMNHLSAIERLEARGTQYANQDFDVLSSAVGFLNHARQLASI